MNTCNDSNKFSEGEFVRIPFPISIGKPIGIFGKVIRVFGANLLILVSGRHVAIPAIMASRI